MFAIARCVANDGERAVLRLNNGFSKLFKRNEGDVVVQTVNTNLLEFIDEDLDENLRPIRS